MPVVIRCPKCKSKYRLKNRLAGQQMQCKKCSILSRFRHYFQPHTLDQIQLRLTSIQHLSHPSSTTGIRRADAIWRDGQRRFNHRIAIRCIWGSVALFGGKGRQADNLDVVTADDLTVGQKQIKDDQYQAVIEKEKKLRNADALDELIEEFGAHRVATVTFTQVVGDTNDANRYLERKLFRAAYKSYTKTTPVNRDKSESMRGKAAMGGRTAPGPAFPFQTTLRSSPITRFPSGPLSSDGYRDPIPRSSQCGRGGNTFTFYVAPCGGLSEFAERVGVGEMVSARSREIVISSHLPTPIPHPDVEELVIQYGQENVASIRVKSARGEVNRVMSYLNQKTATIESDEQNVNVVAMKALGNGGIRVLRGSR